MTIKKSLYAAFAAILLGLSAQVFAALTEEQAQAVVDDPNRTADEDLDMRRHPAQLLIFTGVEPGMRVGDFDAGGGWTAELMARAVGSDGMVYSRTSDRGLEGLQERLSAPGLEHVVPVVEGMTSAFTAEANELDIVIGLFAFHHLVQQAEENRAAAYANVMAALKPGGYFVVSDTQARAGAPASVGSTLHRMDPNLMRTELEKAGFEFVEATSLLFNPNDPLDIPARDVDGVATGFLHKYMKPE
jgi:predicted methyltransferase